MEKRKMLLLVPMLHQGGFERVCVTTARLLEPYYDITIAIFDDADIAYDVEGLKIVNLNLGVQQGKLKKIWNIFRRVRKVRALKHQLQPQVAYSLGSTANLINALSHTTQTKVWLGLRSYGDLLEKGKLKIFTQYADLIICCSKQIETELQEKFHFFKTTTLYNPYDVELIRKTASEHEPQLPYNEQVTYLLSMGRDDELKAFWHMLKAFKRIYESHPECRLMILGEGEYAESKKLAQELGIGDKVFFAGMQTEPYGYLKKGLIYLLTSKIEGFPNALVEGMSLGLAAVSVDCNSGPAEIILEKYETGIKEVRYGEYGILFPQMSPEPNYQADDITPEEEKLAAVVADLLENKELLEKYQKSAVERAQLFTYDNYVQQILSLEVENACQ